jgi:tRNA(fMet)-specific endonuclease VapC
MMTEAPSYVLNTDTIVYLQKRHDTVLQRLVRHPLPTLFTTIINQAELLFGAYNSDRHAANLATVHDFLNTITILPFCAGSCDLYARHRADLQRQGRRLDDMDLMIASITLFHGKILVTNNTRHFGRIKGLRLENWTLP